MPSAPGLSGRARGADRAGPTRLRIHETEVSSSVVENMAMDVYDSSFFRLREVRARKPERDYIFPSGKRFQTSRSGIRTIYLDSSSHPS